MVEIMDEVRNWTAVVARDAGADGAFVYAVRTTGVYCRPSCPARRARRENVVFFRGAEEAERAGFRACRRCRPGEVAPGAAAVAAACRYLEGHADEPVRLAELAGAAGIPARALARVFRKLTGVSLRQYADALRTKDFKARLRAGEGVAGAVYDSGYGSSSRVYEREYGMTPATYRRGGRGACIRYSIVPCALGRLLVAATQRGVCAVSLGGSDVELAEGLEREFPRAEIARDDVGVGAWAEEIARRAAGARPHLDLPLDVQATAFQRLVWERLRAIPHGETRSYGEIARGLGRPGAARAVARACATNPVALAIPCHRVVRDNGGLGGYRWGVDRKRALLAEEEGHGEDRGSR